MSADVIIVERVSINSQHVNQVKDADTTVVEGDETLEICKAFLVQGCTAESASCKPHAGSPLLGEPHAHNGRTAIRKIGTR